MFLHQGGCLCGEIRYETTGEPARIVFCHCRFCQRATGTSFLLEAMFARSDFRILKGEPRRYELTSVGSGKQVVVNLCANCGTKLFLDLERVPNDIGLYTGTYDDPNWFERLGRNAKHIFLDSAQRDTLIHASVPVFREHVTSKEGTATMPEIFATIHQVKCRA
ncbi:MAG TPA: GFA family protein [Hyphomicrobiaceae bacterium]|nr:GFA family protein [Hyphomicrobiaceae bacterium]